MRKIFLLLFGVIAINSIAQKTPYIPLYLQDTTTVDGHQFTWSKTVQSANFTIIWGDSAGLNPLNAPDPSLVFDPSGILDTMETIYQAFVNFGFAQDTSGTNLNQYKIPIVMLNTFGPTGVTGWAFGGDADGVMGAFWAHPLAMQTGHVAAHEFTHSLQSQSVIDYRTAHGLGSVWNNAGIFWETHANFMRNLLYPQDVTAWGMDVYHIETWGDWKNTYENYEMLLAMMESDSIAIVNRLWRESFSNEYPLQAYKRLMNYTQQQFNDRMYDYAKRMATFDFSYHNIGNYFRQYRADDLIHWLPSVQATYTILKQDPFMSTHFSVPVEIAPEEFAYNIIPLHPDTASCAVIIKFKGHLDENSHAGWRYGFVTSHADGTVSRYSNMYSQDSSLIGFSLMPGETQLFLVVMGAPDVITTNTSNDTWHGYPKHYRFPYELTITGGYPEGYQGAADFRTQLKTNGHLHSNGGGWIANTATVSSSVFVAPYSMVLGNSNISGNVKIENTSLVKNAIISGHVEVRDNAFITGGIYTDSAMIKGQAYAENDTMMNSAVMDMRAKVSNYKLRGTIEVGGDVVVYNSTGDCDNGVYYRMTNYYQDNLLECDGRTAAYPANLDVNNVLTPFTAGEMNLPCNCAGYPNCLTIGINEIKLLAGEFIVYPNPASGIVNFSLNSKRVSGSTISFFNSIGVNILTQKIASDDFNIDVSTFPQGLYIARILTGGHNTDIKIMIEH